MDFHWHFPLSASFLKSAFLQSLEYSGFYPGFAWLFCPAFQSLLLLQFFFEVKITPKGSLQRTWQTLLLVSSSCCPDSCQLWTWIRDCCILLYTKKKWEILYLHPNILWDASTFTFLKFHIDTLSQQLFYFLAHTKSVSVLIPHPSGKFHCGWCAPFHVIFLLP